AEARSAKRQVTVIFNLSSFRTRERQTVRLPLYETQSRSGGFLYKKPTLELGEVGSGVRPIKEGCVP
ncbi:MAG TPA: hypothetical protein VJP78_07615, partial [Thermoleophilia bacterium]|nr:hypothetical protein [Thermoleophilia bacterium]